MTNPRGVWTRTKWKRQAVAANPTCCYCGQRIGIGPEWGYLEATVDHVQPLCKGGLDREDNWALACRLCNQSKGGGRFTQAKRLRLLCNVAAKANRRPKRQLKQPVVQGNTAATGTPTKDTPDHA